MENHDDIAKMFSAPDNPGQGVIDPTLADVQMSATDSGQADVEKSGQDPGQTATAVGGQAPAPSQALAEAQAPAPVPASAPAQVQAQIPVRPNVPFDNVNGKIILPPDELFCRIAYTDPDSSRNPPDNWKLCSSDGVFTPRGLREHLWTSDHFHWRRGDEIKAANSADLSNAAANGIQPRIFKLARTNEDIVRRGPLRTPKASVASAFATTATGTLVQANTEPQTTATSAAPSLVAGHVPPPGTKFGSYYEVNGRWYVQHSDGAWYDHGAST